MSRASLLIRSLWTACLFAAGANHARILILHGWWWDYGGAPWPSAAYWTALTFLDPLVAALLFVLPRTSVVATVALIGSNVVHNLAFTAQRTSAPDFVRLLATDWHPIAQIAFLLFTLATARIAWAAAGSNQPSRT